MVGFFGFDSIKYIEDKIKPIKQTDQLNSPDISLIISKEVLVFDKINNCVYIIMYSENNIDSYNNTQLKLNKIQQTLKISQSVENSSSIKSNIENEISYNFKKNDFLDSVNKIKEYIKMVMLCRLYCHRRCQCYLIINQ